MSCKGKHTYITKSGTILFTDDKTAIEFPTETERDEWLEEHTK